LKDVSHEKDFTLVDVLKRSVIEGVPVELSDNEHLYLPRPMSYRTWIYHDKYKQAEAANSIGKKSDAFLWEALSERCVDFQDLSAGYWSSAMIYLPVVPFTILASDTTVFVATLLLAGFCMLVSMATNYHQFYFWTRAMTAPVRLVIMIIVLARMKGGALNIVGYLIPFCAVLLDFYLGDIKVLCSGQFYCRYELVRALPNQVFICLRKGDNERDRGPRKPLSEKITGVAASGMNELCLVANLQGLLLELVPVDKEADYPSFDATHTAICMNPALPKVKFMGTDLFHGNLKSVMDYEILEKNQATLKKRQQEQREALKNPDSLIQNSQGRGKPKPIGEMTVEEIV
jgi:hypothetical protein